MTVVQRRGDSYHIVLNAVEAEEVQTVKYLGAMCNEEGSCDGPQGQTDTGGARFGEGTVAKMEIKH